MVVMLAVIAVFVLLAPLWAGYFGPESAVYARTWRPWYSGMTVQVFRTEPGQEGETVTMESTFTDHMPGDFEGRRGYFHSVERHHWLLPWIVTHTYTGG
jgi:hypothetical protein